MELRKLNPPILDSIIGAQAGEYLKIPFQMNRSVAAVEVVTMVAIIKSVQTNTIIMDGIKASSNIYYKNNSWWVDFNIGSALTIGQHYKVQLAYANGDVDSPNVGFYSSVATFKYTALPEILIQGLDDQTININTYEYTGAYINEKDKSEKVYSYWFNIYKLGNETLNASSGELLHNSSTDKESDRSTDTWTTRLGDSNDYLIEYFVKTINGLEVSSPKYRIANNQTVESNILKYYDFNAINVNDGAYVELSLTPKANTENKMLNGQFVLLRASDDDDYKSWYQLTEFILADWDSSVKKYLCRDYCVAQGTTYIYALQAFNVQGIYSKKYEANPVAVDFEDMYLSDGDRQLRIRYNPKVTSFKNTILEAKMDTIGGKYPFFFRNGNVKYKEFPISGLISALSDENGEFLEGIQLVDQRRVTTAADPSEAEKMFGSWTALSAQNFHREREFKLAVMDWLTNGKPKLFRSPGEGNYLVRLMNTSLSPNDTVSRLLHTFTCTAYEIADCSFENLRLYGMLMEEKIETRDLEFKQVNLADLPGGQWTGNAVIAVIQGEPHTRFTYKLQNDIYSRSAALGFTGQYEFDRNMLADNPITEISIESNNPEDWYNGTLLYANYVDTIPGEFSAIDRVEIEDRIEQWIGRNTDEIYIRLDSKGIRNLFGTFYYIKVMSRPQIKAQAIEREGGYYIFKDGEGEIYNPSPEVIVVDNNKYYDGRTHTLMNELNYNFKLGSDDTTNMQGQNYSLQTTGRIVLTDVGNVSYMYIGNAVYADVVYSFFTNYYVVEREGTVLANMRKKWENAVITGSEDADILYAEYYSTLCDALYQQGGLVSADAL